jgi:hypothetical protein
MDADEKRDEFFHHHTKSEIGIRAMKAFNNG